VRVLILHDLVPAGARPDESDAAVQAGVVGRALSDLGHQHSTVEVGLDLDAAARRIRRARPDLAFNLVESAGGHGRLIHLAPALLDALRIPYTGCPTEAIFVTSSKLLAKRVLAAAAIDTPAWIGPVPGWRGTDLRARGSGQPLGRCIIKSVWEHASVGLGPDSILDPESAQHLRGAIEARLDGLGGEAFAEAFIDGREFNLSMLEIDGRAEVLPVPEIVFEGYGAQRPRMVCYRAKWDEESYEYRHTPRRFECAPEDRDLYDRLRAIAGAAWDLLGLRGYARIDFRVDSDGRPWVLEVNTNPCLSPDAGFMAAAEQAQLAPIDVVRHLIAPFLT
jgi:D-alanine-D-alanine ligase